MAKTWVNFEHVRNQLSFERVFDHYELEMRGTGEQVKGRCPFHGDEKPSLGINIGKGLFNCFAGSCGASGTVLDFAVRMEGFDPDDKTAFRKGSEQVCHVFGLEPAPANRKRKKSKGRKSSRDAKNASSRRRKASEAEYGGGTQRGSENGAQAATEQVANTPLTFQLKLDGEHPYLSDRDMQPRVIEKFGIGFCNRGMMKGRICFPIHDHDGQLVAYSGRWADDEMPENVPRYLLPKEFRKELVLYNLHRLRAASTNGYTTDQVVIVEGFWSAIHLHQNHVPVVATMGTSISEAQIDLLAASGIRLATVLFDGDEAGRVACCKVVDAISRAMAVRQLELPDDCKPDKMCKKMAGSLARYAPVKVEK